MVLAIFGALHENAKHNFAIVMKTVSMSECSRVEVEKYFSKNFFSEDYCKEMWSQYVDDNQEL
jgi:hypothetical protein